MLRKAAFFLIPIALLALLMACSSGPRKRIFPPTASVQELTVQADGRWQVRLRLQSFSNVPHTVSEVSAQLRVDGIDAATLALSPTVAIGPQNAEIEDIIVTPSPGAAARVQAALDGGRRVDYVLNGTLVSTEPDRRRDLFNFDGQLWPVPGLPGVLR
ncbi:hypothetical protein OS187_02305 [Xanthomonadaceae bacterium JHOS43]|nr:hypothetical protein [Xanthomonadaceae bacterium JHOS43]